MRITFEKVEYRAEKRVKCAGGCGRTLKRAKTFWQTLNPFNKNAAGLPKSRGQITEELSAQAMAWRKAPETCAHCDEQVAA